MAIFHFFIFPEDPKTREIYKKGYKLAGSVIKNGVGSVLKFLKGYDLILKRVYFTP